jgi:trehalose 6-phosphate phosphatase
MTYLLSAEGRRALRSIAARPLLFAFDFDGTLAPISSNRDAVKVSGTVSEWLKELAKRAPCAIVSGRALADLAPRINGAVPHLIGNHGIEGPLSPPPTLLAAEEVCTKWQQEMAIGLAESLATLGAEIENKRYSLTVHFRGVTEPARVGMEVVLLLRRLTPSPRLMMGKYSVNVLPPGQEGKGPAALALMVHLRRSGLFFIGDDETDETVFTLVEGLAMGVRVGRQSESQAKFYLHHQGEVEEVLRFLVHRMDGTPEAVNRDDRMSTGTKETRK